MMKAQELDTAGEYLGHLGDLVVRASPGPFTVARGPRRRWQIVRSSDGVAVATAGKHADAELLAVALPAIRALSSAVVAVLAQHRDAGEGICVACGQATPCPTREAVEHELAPRPRRPRLRTTVSTGLKQDFGHRLTADGALPAPRRQ